MADLFVSYAREDQDLVRRLDEALTSRGKDTWVDWEGIEPSDRWLQAVYDAIEGADAFMFVISPHSLGSPVCAAELDHAAAQHKRLIPVVAAEPPPSTSVPAALAELNWIFLPPRVEWGYAVDEIVRAIDLDLDLVRIHTSVLGRARAWELSGRRTTPLLRGEELERAERWLARATEGAEPRPTELQARFVAESRRVATRRHRAVAGVSMVVAVLSIALALVAVIERGHAIASQKVAQSRLLAAEAENEVQVDASLSTLLAEDALRIDDTPQAEAALRDALENLQSLVVLRGADALNTAAYSPEGAEVVTASDDGTVAVWDARTGAQLRVLKADIAVVSSDAAVNSAVFSPNGSEILTASNDGTARLWDARTGSLVRTIMVDGGVPADAQFSPDGSEIVTASTNGTAQIWDARTGRPLRVLKDDRSTVNTAVFSPNGLEVLTASEDGTARLGIAQ